MHIDWDGTTQLAFGYPHFKESTHGEDKAKQRIANHLNIVIVAGWKILVYDNLDYIYQGPDLTVELLQRTLKKYEEVYLLMCVCVCLTPPPSGKLFPARRVVSSG
jgi:hypothetical protein